MESLTTTAPEKKSQDFENHDRVGFEFKWNVPTNTFTHRILSKEELAIKIKNRSK